jgi:hypothetical protein
LQQLQRKQRDLLLLPTVRGQFTAPARADDVTGSLEKHGLWERLNLEDRRALTPLFQTHINPYGVFELDLESPSFLMAAEARA